MLYLLRFPHPPSLHLLWGVLFLGIYQFFLVPASLTPVVVQPMTIGPYMDPPRLIRSSCLVLPDVPLDFQVDPDFIQHLPIFRGLPDENPYLYMIEFEEVVRSMGPPAHSDFI